MTAEQPIILLTSADVANIENDRSRVNAEIAAMESKIVELQSRRTELSERLAKINALLDALGLNNVSEAASNSVYASRNARTVPQNGAGTY